MRRDAERAGRNDPALREELTKAWAERQDDLRQYVVKLQMLEDRDMRISLGLSLVNLVLVLAYGVCLLLSKRLEKLADDADDAEIAGALAGEPGPIEARKFD